MKVTFFLFALFVAITNANEALKKPLPPTLAAFEEIMKHAKPETEEQANRRKAALPAHNRKMAASAAIAGINIFSNFLV